MSLFQRRFITIALFFLVALGAQAEVCTESLQKDLTVVLKKHFRSRIIGMGKEWKVTALEDRPGYYRLDSLRDSWRGVLSASDGGLVRVFDPNDIAQDVGLEGLESVGVYKQNDRAFIFAGAERLNRLSENRNKAVDLHGSGRKDMKFLLRFYDGNPNALEVLERFTKKLEWPYNSTGDMAPHDWTAHCLAQLIDNEFLFHLQNQINEMLQFRSFLISQSKRFTHIGAMLDNPNSFMSQLIDHYGMYLDNAMATANFAHNPASAIYSEVMDKAPLTPLALFVSIAKKSINGGGPGYSESAHEWVRAINMYGKERSPIPNTTYDLTAEKIRAGMIKKLGSTAKTELH